MASTANTSKDVFTITILNRSQVDDSTLAACLEVFNNNYGIWGEGAPSPIKKGARVRMGLDRVRNQCLFDDNSWLVVAKEDGNIVGHAFASTWKSGALDVCWITQLVVVSARRGFGIATSMMYRLGDKFRGFVFGLASSHPGAVKALSHLGQVDLSFIKQSAASILDSSTVEYLKQAKLHGSLFDAASDGSISCVDTGFFVDHQEPLTALAKIKNWLLGDLLEGHEFLVIVKHKVLVPH